MNVNSFFLYSNCPRAKITFSSQNYFNQLFLIICGIQWLLVGIEY